MKKSLLDCFLRESNAIESEYSEEAFEDSVEAWEYASSNYGDWGVDYIRGIHEKLLCRLDKKIAGKLRRKNVSIVGQYSTGERVILRQIEARGNKPRLRKWCEENEVVESLGEIKEAHIDFEMIHPFSDGNGRTGRILYNIQRVQLGLPIEVFYEKDKQEYYKWFLERRRGDGWDSLLGTMADLSF